MVLERYKLLGSKILKNKRMLQAKHLKECMEIVENAFEPEFDGLHALVQKLNKLNEERMECRDEKKQKMYLEAITITAACIALFDTPTVKSSPEP